MEKFQVTRLSNLTDPTLNSLVLVVRKINGEEVATVFYANDEWTVVLAASGTDTIISWSDFLELTHQISLFVADENKAMLHECKKEGLVENE